MAIRANHPWLYNYLQLPFYTGDRFKFLPFNMYPGHRGYGAVGGSQGILPQNMLQQFVPLLNSLFGNIKFGSESKETSDQSAPSGNQTNAAPVPPEQQPIYGSGVLTPTYLDLLRANAPAVGAVAGGLGGATLGAVASRKARIRNALIGLLAGAALGGGAGYLMNR